MDEPLDVAEAYVAGILEGAGPLVDRDCPECRAAVLAMVDGIRGLMVHMREHPDRIAYHAMTREDHR